MRCVFFLHFLHSRVKVPFAIVVVACRTDLTSHAYCKPLPDTHAVGCCREVSAQTICLRMAIYVHLEIAIRRPTENNDMFALLLLVTLALFSVVNAETCTCSSCKGVTTKDCKVGGANVQGIPYLTRNRA